MSCPNTKSLQMFLPVAITPVLNLNQWDTFHIGFSIWTKADLPSCSTHT